MAENYRLTIQYLRKLVRQAGGPDKVTVNFLCELVKKHGVEVRRFDGGAPKKNDYLVAIAWPGIEADKPDPDAVAKRIGDLATE